MSTKSLQKSGPERRARGIDTAALELKPFENSRDCRFYFGSAGHEQAVDGLMELFRDGNQGFGLLTGAPGLGKTLIRTLLHRRLDPGRFVRVSIESSLLDFDGLLLEIISQIRGHRAHAAELPDRYSRLDTFKRLLSERVVHPGRHLTILVDEAQGLGIPVLEGLRNLSNVSAEHHNLLTIAMIGGSRLAGLVSSLPELAQRVSADYLLLPLDEAETSQYVDHRLRVAGSPHGLALDSTTRAALHELTGGVPAEINRLMKRALQHAKCTDRPLDRSSLAAVLEERRRSRPVSMDELAGFAGI